MTVNTTLFTDWSRKPTAELARWNKSAPALTSLRTGLLNMFPGTHNLGIYGVRDARGHPGVQSVHSFGAAFDISYRGLNRSVGLAIIDWCLNNSDELDIQAIHDYIGGTIWRAVRDKPGTGGWRPQNPQATGMGQPWADWLHIECTEEGWGDGRPMEVKVGTARPNVTLASQGTHVAAAQAIMAEKAGQDVGPIDGWFGNRSLAGWRNVAAFCGLPADDHIDGYDWDVLAWIDGGWDRLNVAGVR
jgi:hypothetical protein